MLKTKAKRDYLEGCADACEAIVAALGERDEGYMNIAELIKSLAKLELEFRVKSNDADRDLLREGAAARAAMHGDITHLF